MVMGLCGTVCRFGGRVGDVVKERLFCFWEKVGGVHREGFFFCCGRGGDLRHRAFRFFCETVGAGPHTTFYFFVKQIKFLREGSGDSFGGVGDSVFFWGFWSPRSGNIFLICRRQ